MTRINLIDVSELSDQHLMAEYRELPMIGSALKRTLNSKSGFQKSKVSNHYCLNGGHVYFFMNKKKFLFKRYQLLIEELRLRGYNINPDAREVDWEVFNKIEQIDWQPDNKDIEVNLERIRERINLKPQWYRWSNYNKSLY